MLPTPLPLRPLLFTLPFLLTACGDGTDPKDPGPLKGVWQIGGKIPMVVEFRSGEAVTLGVREKVSYEQQGEDVLVKYEKGQMSAAPIRFTMTSYTTAKSDLGPLKRLKQQEH